MRLVNCTKHDVVFIDNQANKHVFPCQTPLRLETKIDKAVSLFQEGYEIPTYTVTRKLAELPEEKEDTMYIVSSSVLELTKQKGRHDFVSPFNQVRDSQQKIVGCTAFQR